MLLVRLIAAAIVILAPCAHAAGPAPVHPTTKSCVGPEFRQFDFWIGRWKVFDARDGSPQGESLIEKVYGGCSLRENWKDPQLTGGSLNTYVAIDKHWHQTWTDSAGTWREFIGGLEAANMVLVWSHPSARVPGNTAQERMTFTRNPDGSVRQHMDQTSDGVTWVEGYDYIYRRSITNQAK
jgi:hypothetical protein